MSTTELTYDEALHLVKAEHLDTAKLERFKAALREGMELGEKVWSTDEDSAFIARTRTLLPETCKGMLKDIDTFERIRDASLSSEPGYHIAERRLAEIVNSWTE